MHQPPSIAPLPPRAHAVPDPAESHFWAAWHPAWALFGLLLAFAALYLAAWQHRRRPGPAGAAPPGSLRPRHAVAYLAGLAAVAFALAGPLDAWNAASFSLHMLQHLCLVLVAAPLLVLGRPWQVIAQGLPRQVVGRVSRAVLRPELGRRTWRLALHPLTAFAFFNGAMVLWHLPALYVAALVDEGLHQAEHLTFLISALLLWYQVLPPPPHRPPSSTTARALLLFGTALAGDVVAAGLTLSTRVLYPPYAGRPGLGGRDALADQSLGGLIMWLSGAVFYLLTFWVLVVDFRRDRERALRRSSA